MGYAPVDLGSIKMDAPPAGFMPVDLGAIKMDDAPEGNSFIGDMGENFTNGLQSAKDLVTGNFQDIGSSSPTPKTQALGDKLFPEGSDGSLMDAVSNVRNIKPSDVSGAVLEKFGVTPEGKALSAMGGLIPSWNLAGTEINHYVNPFISNHTGIAPDNLQLAEMLGSTIGLKGSKNVNTPDLAIAKNLAGKLSDSMSLKPPAVTSDMLGDASNQNYQAMKNQGATLNRSGMNTVTYNVGKALDDSGLMNNSLHGDTMSVVSDMNADAAKGQMSLEKLDQYRQLLNQAVKKNTSKIDGMNPDAMKAQTAIGALDDAVNGLGAQHIDNPAAIDTLNQARALYAGKARMGTVENIIENAKMTDNPATAIKTGFRNLAKNVNVNPRGWTPEEIDAINHAAHTGIVTGALRVAGSRLTPIAAGAAGYATGGPMGALVGAGVEHAISGGARALAAKLQESRGNAVLNQIAQRPELQGVNPVQAVPQQAIPYSPMNPLASALKASIQKQRN